MSSFSVESAIHWVGQLLVQEVRFLHKVSDKVEELKSELEWMQCFLLDAERKQNKNAIIRKWVSNIRDLAQESEDVIDMYILQVSNKREEAEGLIPWTDLRWLLCLWMDCITLHSVGCKIDAITGKISKLSLRLQTYGIKSSYDMTSLYLPTERTLLQQGQTSAHTQDDDVVGLEKDIKCLVTELLEGKEKVLLIHGMGGVGKTTLAKEVFRHKGLRGTKKFVGFAWGHVSQTLQLGSLCKGILFELLDPKEEEEEKERNSIEKLGDSDLLFAKVREVLRRKNCLVVLDDMWKHSDWTCLEFALEPFNVDCQSKLLVTTRNSQILQSAPSSMVYYHGARPLELHESEKLFRKKANFKNGADPLTKVNLVQKFLAHCGGNPLAIVVLGRVLATKETSEEWQSVYDNLRSYLRGDEYSGVHQALAMSYNELPFNLKPCFMCLGLFPEDFEINVERLYHLWIAEGIVPVAQYEARGKTSMEDIAKTYLDELVQRAMVQVATRDSDGGIMTCKFHDLMRDMCLEIAQEENFLQVVDHYVRTNDRLEQEAPPRYAINERLRRLVIRVGHKHGIHASFPNSSSSRKVSCLRSLLLFPTDEAKEEDCEWINKVSKDYPLLRILDLSGLPLSRGLPRCVDSLIYLRYLSLRGTQITELPSSIRYLRSLLILDLRVRDVVIRLPNVFSKMNSLRQIYFPCRSFYLNSLETGYEIEQGNKLSLKNLSNLEMIEDVELDGVDVEGLLELTSVQKLAASCLREKECLDPFLQSSSIKKMSLKIKAPILVEHPQTLSSCNFLHVLHVDDDKRNWNPLPTAMLEMFPQNLVELGFWYCQISKDFIPVLERLPRLKRLELHLCYGGDKLQFTSGGFPKLTYLIIDGLFNLEEWTVEKECLPNLEKIEIYNSPIQKLPDVLSRQVIIHCKPCVDGIERYGSCLFFNKKATFTW